MYPLLTAVIVLIVAYRVDREFSRLRRENRKLRRQLAAARQRKTAEEMAA